MYGRARTLIVASPVPLPKLKPGTDPAGAPMWPAVVLVPPTAPVARKSARAGGSIELAPVGASAPLWATTCWMVVVAWWRMTSIDERARARLLRRLLAGDSVSQAMTHHPPFPTRGASAHTTFLPSPPGRLHSLRRGRCWLEALQVVPLPARPRAAQCHPQRRRCRPRARRREELLATRRPPLHRCPKVPPGVWRPVAVRPAGRLGWEW